MFNLKKRTKLYLVEGDNKYSIDIYSDVNASQTYDEQSSKKKTLHRPGDLYAGASISRANPVNFSFTSPIKLVKLGLTTPILLDLATSLTNYTVRNFDLYIVNDYVTYKISKAVIESVTFNISRDSVLTMSVSGTASKKEVYSIPTAQSPIPGVLVDQDGSYTYVARTSVSINNAEVYSLAGVNIDFRNEIKWVPNNTINSAINGGVVFPEKYVLEARQLSGSITEFLTDGNIVNLPDTSTSSAISIKIFTDETDTPVLNILLNSAVYTRRLSMDEIYTRVYDFRANSNKMVSTVDYGAVDPSLSLDFTGLTSSLPVNPTLVLNFI